jgi:NAD(P)-dependent dehydrogenase (short-subunit alcohol dehydrogenase family)
LATVSDLEETRRLVGQTGRRIYAVVSDVRDRLHLASSLEQGIEELGHVDIVVANAGIATFGADDDAQAWQDSLDVNLTGVFNTVTVATPHMIERGEGGSIVITSSNAGFKGSRLGGVGGAGSGYVASKHGIVGVMRNFAKALAEYSIRVNTIHPTGVASPMVQNEMMDELIARTASTGQDRMQNLLPVELLDPMDVSNAIAWLVSDDARYVTGITLPVDAGFNVK